MNVDASLAPSAQPTPSRPVSAHLAPLDGIRAAAVILVLFSHSVIFGEFPALHEVGLMSGYNGICLFFVLSGYLITRLLIREEDRFGDVSLKLFYLRRAVRLFPALWLYLAVVVVIWSQGHIPDHPGYSFLSSLLYLRNIVGRGVETHHLWSLSVEEQFYLLWPIVFIALARKHLARLAVCFAVVVLVVTWRWYAWREQMANAGQLYIRSDFRFDSPLIGCAIALVERVRPRVTAAFNSSRWRSDIFCLLGGAGIAVWTAYQLHYGQVLSVDSTIVSLLSGIIVCSQIGPARGWAGRLLSCRPLVFLGKISYGVYLWQGLFVGHATGIFAQIRVLPWNLTATFAVALLSYYLLERPLLRYKDRSLHRRTTNTPVGAG
ncbi:acyltransferase [Gemmata sp. JC673]|uniref:Acyltransferase n=1 Tax=Gemmata algarum TaxID=2975278 RepID=A0ABU5ETA1_9BACT|nr:acyltransferase [Gemmata algarum]MDY3558316.1 acyltransferase [Gemmata algarum]